MRVLVAGATGHLGPFLVHALDRRGHVAVALVRDPDALARPGHHGAPIAAAQEVRVRTQPPLPLRTGRAVRHTHDYRRYGVIDLFAAFVFHSLATPNCAWSNEG